ncbi:MAG: hypothetical protein Q8S33_23995 [Myxococcales bacterium]|nr:hypothetical protein [Myxococcales bacterium]
MSTRLCGEDVLGVHESLELDRVRTTLCDADIALPDAAPRELAMTVTGAMTTELRLPDSLAQAAMELRSAS